MVMDKFSMPSSYSNLFAFFNEEQPRGSKCFCLCHLGIGNQVVSTPSSFVGSPVVDTALSPRQAPTVKTCSCETVATTHIFSLGTPPIALHYPYLMCDHMPCAYSADMQRMCTLRPYKFIRYTCNEAYVLSSTLPPEWYVSRDVPVETVIDASHARSGVRGGDAVVVMIGSCTIGCMVW